MLEEIKSYLKITWSDEDADIQSMIDRGKKRLEGLAGAALDFSVAGLAQELLFDYCRYAYNNALEYFEENFENEILRLQLKTGVELLAGLTSLEIEGVTLSPEFTSLKEEYTATTTDASNVITATPINSEATVNISVNMSSHENGTAYEWMVGINNVTITVIDEDTVKIYSVSVAKS